MARYNPLLTTEEAAEVIGISVRQLNRLCRSQVLNAVFPQNKGRRFRESDVMAYLEIKDKKLDMPTLAIMSRQAYATSRAVEQQLEQLLFYLGVDIPRLGCGVADVIRLYVQVEDALDDEEELDRDKVLDWARIFYAVTEDYLGLIKAELEDPEPWKKMLDLANQLYKNAPREKFNIDKELASAYGFLDAGRRNLRNVSYFYIRNSLGPRAASAAFPVAHGGRNERIINLAFPDQQ